MEKRLMKIPLFTILLVTLMSFSVNADEGEHFTLHDWIDQESENLAGVELPTSLLNGVVNVESSSEEENTANLVVSNKVLVEINKGISENPDFLITFDTHHLIEGESSEMILSNILKDPETKIRGFGFFNKIKSITLNTFRKFA